MVLDFWWRLLNIFTTFLCIHKHTFLNLGTFAYFSLFSPFFILYFIHSIFSGGCGGHLLPLPPLKYDHLYQEILYIYFTFFKEPKIIQVNNCITFDLYILHSLKKTFVVKVKNTFFLSFCCLFLVFSWFTCYFLFFSVMRSLLRFACQAEKSLILTPLPPFGPPKSYCFPLLCTIDVEDGAS